MSSTKAVWVTVVGGVILIPISWGLEAVKDKLPSWLNWLGDLASWFWHWLSTPWAIPTWIILFAIVLFALVVYVARQAVQTAKEMEAERDRRREKERVAVLTEEEHLVMETLAWADGPVELNELQEQTKLSRLRLDHAVAKLRSRLYVRKNDVSWGTQVEPLHAGREYIVQNNLDKPPF